MSLEHSGGRKSKMMQVAEPQPRLLTIRRGSKILGCSPITTRARQGIVPGWPCIIEINGHRYLEERQCLSYVERQLREAERELAERRAALEAQRAALTTEAAE